MLCRSASSLLAAIAGRGETVAHPQTERVLHVHRSPSPRDYVGAKSLPRKPPCARMSDNLENQARRRNSQGFCSLGLDRQRETGWLRSHVAPFSRHAKRHETQPAMHRFARGLIAGSLLASWVSDSQLILGYGNDLHQGSLQTALQCPIAMNWDD